MLWSDGHELLDNKQFVQKFKMQEPICCKETKKVTAYFVIETERTINLNKYTEKVQAHLTQKNIWIKNTKLKTENSPGYMTLVYHNITNKEDYTEHLTQSRIDTEIDREKRR